MKYGIFFTEIWQTKNNWKNGKESMKVGTLRNCILRSVFFRTHQTPPICLKMPKCAILSPSLAFHFKHTPKVGVYRENFKIVNWLLFALTSVADHPMMSILNQLIWLLVLWFIIWRQPYSATSIFVGFIELGHVETWVWNTLIIIIIIGTSALANLWQFCAT